MSLGAYELNQEGASMVTAIFYRINKTRPVSFFVHIGENHGTVLEFYFLSTIFV